MELDKNYRKSRIKLNLKYIIADQGWNYLKSIENQRLDNLKCIANQGWHQIKSIENQRQQIKVGIR